MIDIYRFKYFGESTLVLQLKEKIDFDQLIWLYGLERYLQEKYTTIISETVVTYHEIAISICPNIISLKEFKEKLNQVLQEAVFTFPQNEISKIQMPICYDDLFALDKDRISDHTGLTWNNLVQKHVSSQYRVYMLGFIPGFVYLGGMSPHLACPRLDNPRLKVHAGSVGIADQQTGIYAIDSPGGWNIIGKTPVILNDFSPQSFPLLHPLDIVEFSEIDLPEFNHLSSLASQGLSILKKQPHGN